MIATFWIAGSRHHVGAMELLATIPDDTKLDLTRAPDNKYDRNAITITHEGHMLGYVPASIARRIAPAMDAVGLVAMKGTFNALDRTHVSVTIDEPNLGDD